MKRLPLVLALIPLLVSAQTPPVFGGARKSSVSPSGVSTQPITAPSFVPAAQDFIYYVATTGSDGNACTSAASPCLTIQAALAKIPTYWRQKARVYVAAGTYTLPSQTWLTVGHSVMAGEPFVLEGAMVDSGLGERTITSVGTVGGYVYQVTDNTLAPTLDQYVGYTVRITSGTAAGMTRIVRGNTTGGLFEMNEADFSASYRPAVGDKFVIERPGTIIEFQGTNSGLDFRASSSKNGAAIVRNVKFQIAGAGATIFNVAAPAGLCFQRVQFDLGTIGYLYVGRRSQIYAGSCNMVDIGTEFFNSASWLEEGAGLFLSGTNRPLSIMDEGLFHGYVVSRGVKLMGSRASTMFLFSPDLAGGANIYAYESVLKIQKQIAALYGRIVSPTSYGIKLEQNSSGQAIQYIDITGSTGDGILLEANSQAYLQYVSGSSNTSAGLRLNGSSIAKIASNVTLTGTAGEILVGTQSTTHAAVYAGTPLVDLVGGSAMKDSAALPSVKVAGLTVGSAGTPISLSVRCSATLATDAIAAGTTVTQDIACTGAAVGAECSVGGPATLEAGLTQSCRVSSTGHVDLRTANVTAGSITPAASQTVSVRVLNP
jgi:hypothetical protein